MREVFLPRTATGRWAVILIAAFAAFFMLFNIMAIAGLSIGNGSDTFFGNLALAIPLLLAAFCGIAAFVTGMIAITLRKDFTVLVILAAVIGLNVLLFALGELLFPH
jgi:hypothetical protein